MILLDTHVWVWWVQGDARLSREIVGRLDASAPGSVAVSAISFWEIAMLAQRGRIMLPVAPEIWLQDASSDPRLVVLPISADVATQAALLINEHRDPADRFLMAQAITGGYTLLTEDVRILAAGIKALRPQDAFRD